jgi:hypothetical protein
MLQEIDVAQNTAEPRRRWFANDYFDLIVWLDEDLSVVAFQLCYDKSSDEHAVTWQRDTGYSHRRVAAAPEKPGRKTSTMFVAGGALRVGSLKDRFEAASRDIEADVRSFVLEKLQAWDL